MDMESDPIWTHWGYTQPFSGYTFAHSSSPFSATIYGNNPYLAHWGLGLPPRTSLWPKLINIPSSITFSWKRPAERGLAKHIILSCWDPNQAKNKCIGFVLQELNHSRLEEDWFTLHPTIREGAPYRLLQELHASISHLIFTNQYRDNSGLNSVTVMTATWLYSRMFWTVSKYIQTI